MSISSAIVPIMQQAHLFVRYRLWNYRARWLALKFSDRPDGVAVRITCDQWLARFARFREGGAGNQCQANGESDQSALHKISL
jgi:hypothetical protein